MINPDIADRFVRKYRVALAVVVLLVVGNEVLLQPTLLGFLKQETAASAEASVLLKLPAASAGRWRFVTQVAAGAVSS